MLFLIALFVFTFTFVLTPAVIALSWKIGAVDIPQDWRRMHRESVPRGGGLAVFLPFCCGCVLLGEYTPVLSSALFGGGLMLAVGLLDDVFCLGPWSKLLLQLAATTAAVLGGGVTNGWETVIAILWILSLINAHNFIDGMDGLLVGCAGIEALSLGAASVLAGKRTVAQAALLLALACFAFRPYNRYPARVFAGDCGSEALGFLLGILSLPLLFNGSPSLSALSPVFLLAYPLVDMITAVLRRLLRGRSPLSADRGHLHHRLYAAGLSVPECVGILLTVCAMLGVIGVLLVRESLWIFASVACLLTVFVFIGMRNYVVSNGFIVRR